MSSDEKEEAPEQATVWVSDEFRQPFIEIFEKYLKGRPKRAIRKLELWSPTSAVSAPG
jgi:hypothetical protein